MTQKQIDGLTLKERLDAPTPKFFRRLKLIGLMLATLSATLLAAPAALPPIISTIAGYMAIAGSVASAVSEITVES